MRLVQLVDNVSDVYTKKGEVDYPLLFYYISES